MAAPEVDHAVAEAVRMELARLHNNGAQRVLHVSCTSPLGMAHSAQSDGMRERVCVARTCQSMVLTSTDVLPTARLYVGATVPQLQAVHCIAAPSPARQAAQQLPSARPSRGPCAVYASDSDAHEAVRRNRDGPRA